MPEDTRTAADTVKLRNTARRPLLFRVAGRTLRLSPGETVEVPRAWTGSAEVQRFCSTGLMMQSQPAASVADGEAAAAAGADGGGEEGESETESTKRGKKDRSASSAKTKSPDAES